MSKLPQLNLRIPEPFHGLIRDIAQRLRERDGDQFGRDLTFWLHDQPEPGRVDVGGLAGQLEYLVGRVDRLEAKLALYETPTAPAVIPAKLNAPYPDEVLAQANDLNNQGMTWLAVWKELGEPGTVSGLRNAVAKRRKRAA